MNNKNKFLLIAGLSLSFALPTYSFAAETETKEEDAYATRLALANEIKKYRAMRKELPIPPPAGLFGVYAFPEEGQYVVGINMQHFKFSGMLQGTDSISADEVVASVANPFFGDAGQPPTLRVVPESAEATVIYPFINYSLNKKISLVAMAPMIKKTTVLNTYDPTGTASIGLTEVNSSGLGDIKMGAIYKFFNSPDRKHNVIFDIVMSVPTGSITEEDYNLTPFNTMVMSRLAYGMQLGSGTYDAILGGTYWGKNKKWGWGTQYLATIPLESANSEGWRYGDKHELTTWVSYAWEPSFNSSLRLRGESQGTIVGIDPKIYGPGLGADTGNYGGTKVEFIIGSNWMYSPGYNISLEFSIPIIEDRNGVQPDQDSAIMLSWRSASF